MCLVLYHIEISLSFQIVAGSRSRRYQKDEETEDDREELRRKDMKKGALFPYIT